MSRARSIVQSALFADLLAVGVFFAIAAAVCVRWAHPGAVVYYQDTFFLFDPANFVHKQIVVWDDYLSIAGRFRSGIVLWPQLAVVAAFCRIFGTSYGQMLAIGFAIAGSWACMYWWLRVLGFGRIASAAGSAGYAWNPWTMTQFPGNFDVLYCLLAAAAVGAVLASARRFPARRRLCLAALALIAGVPVAVVAANPGVLLMFSLFCLVAFAIAMASVSGGERTFATFGLAAAACMGLASLWFLVPTALEYLLSAAVMEKNAQAVDWVVRRASLDNDIRFLASWSWGLPQYEPYAARYDANPLVYASGFTLFVAAVSSLVWRLPSRAKITRLCVLAALIALFLSKGLHPPLAWINGLTYKLPLSALWREPTSKFPVIAFAPLAICLAAFLEYVRTMRRGLAARLAAAAVPFVAIALSVQPLLAGTQVYTVDTPQTPSSYVTVPPYWFEAAKWLNEKDDAGSAVVLPADPFYQATYDWGLRAVDLLPSDLFHRHVIVLGNLVYTASSTDVSLFPYLDDLVSGRSKALAAALKALGVRYVVFRGDIVQSGAAQTADQIARLFPGAPVRRFGKLTIFDLGSSSVPLISTISDWIEGDYGARTPADQLELATMLEDVPRLDRHDVAGREPGVAPLAFEAHPDTPRHAKTGSPLRYVWSSPVKRFSGRVADASRVFFGVRRRPAGAQNAAIVTPIATSEPASRSAGRPLVAFANQSQDTRGRIFYAYNPSASPILADVEIGVHPATSTTYVLGASQKLYADSIGASTRVVWARFQDVYLAPGLNDLSLSETKRPGGRASTGEDGLTVDAFRASVRAVGRATSTLGSNGSLLALDAAKRPHDTFASFRIDSPLSAEPVLTVRLRGTLPVVYGAIVDFDDRSTAYRCYGFLGAGGRLDVEAIVLSCLETAGMPRTSDAVSRIRVTGIDLDAALPSNVTAAMGRVGIADAEITWPHPERAAFSRVTIGRRAFLIRGDEAVLRAGAGAAAVTVDAESAITTGVIGHVPFGGVEAVRQSPGWFPVLATLHADRGFVRLRQSYSPTWIAICWGGCSPIAPHYRDGGGWNAWWIAGGGSVALVNLGVLLYFCAAFASSITILALGVRAFPRFR